MYDDEQPVVPDGMAIRRLRRERGWSRRELLREVRAADERATGTRGPLSLNELEGIEEVNEAVPYAVVCRIAAGLDADPIDLVRAERA